MRSTQKRSREARLDAVFGALSDGTRRRILARLARGSARVSDLAEPFAISLPAVCKHLDVLEHAGLLRRERDGRVSRCHLDARPLESAEAFIERYRVFWSGTLEALALYVEKAQELADQNLPSR
ncbi:MAG TPA: metalloregulator ArsR/SmtB family transcription factor [Polyangiaceae bacterium]|jgi:DNA-binding transcriptional ArsR family regulator